MSLDVQKQHKLAVQYQRSWRRLSKAELDLAFLRDCKMAEVYPKFIRWKNINQAKKKKRRQKFHKLLLNEGINEKNTDINYLRNKTAQLKTAIFQNTTWMKAQLIVFSVNRLLRLEKTQVKRCHAKKLEALLHTKTVAEKLESNPNKVIINLSGEELTLRHRLATRPNNLEMMAVSEDLFDQLDRLNCWKEGFFVQDKVKNSLRSFTYNCLDLDLKEYFTDRKRIRTLASMSKTLWILKPDKGNGVVILKRSDYVNSLNSIFNNPSKFSRLNNDPTNTRLTTLQHYLSTLRNRGEISGEDFEFMRPKAASFGRAHGAPKTHKDFIDLPTFRPIIDTTTTPHYNVGKFLASLLNLLTLNQFNLNDTFDAVSAIKAIPSGLFDEGYRFVSFDVVSPFTNVPVKPTIDLVLKQLFDEKLINTTLSKRTLKKLISNSCSKTAFLFDNKI